MRAYLDYNASAPLRPEARAALLAALEGHGNASSPHAEGQRARALVEEARREVADLVGAHPREVVFTGGGTEALNLAVQGAVLALHGQRDQVIVSAVEHEAVLGPAEALAGQGVRCRRVEVDAEGVVRLERLDSLLGERTALVGAMLANNETGVIQPVREVALRARRQGALVLVDAVQAAGRIAVDFRTLGADYLAVSAHKLGGPQGVGALVVRRGAPLVPVLHGGGQEQGFRPGTESVAAVAGFAAAARAAGRDLEAESARLLRLRDRLERALGEAVAGARVNGAGGPRLANTTSVTLPGVDAQALVVRLDLEGVAVSTGAACASGAAEPSHVLAAMGRTPEERRSTLRISTGWATTEDDVDRAAAAIAAGAAAQRRLLALGR